MQYNDRIDIYKNVLKPPKDFKIDWVELTTWSLAKDFLRLIQAMIISANKDNAPDKLVFPNMQIKFSKKEEIRFHVFYDGKVNLELEEGVYYRTANGKYTQYLLSRCCTPVKLNEGLFHPKIILAQFKKKDTDDIYKYRVCISSRNLTWSRYVEAGVILESEDIDVSKISDTEKSGKGSGDPGKELKQFFKKYYDEYAGNHEHRINFDALENAKFYVMENNHNETKIKPKLFFGKSTCLLKQIENFIEDYKDKYKSDEYRFRICSMNPNKNLWNFSDDIKTEYICNFKDIYEESKSCSGKWVKRNGKDNHWYIGSDERNPKALHIKQYMFWKNFIFPETPVVRIFIGSANCSENSLKNRNEEVLVLYDTCGSNAIYFPCKGPGNGFEFAEFGGKVLRCFKDTIVKEPNIENMEDEEAFPQIKVTVCDENYDDQNLILKFKILNKEDYSIFVRLATFDESQSVKIQAHTKSQEIRFSMNKSNFTPLLLVMKENEPGKLYNIFLNLKERWYGREYTELKKELPSEEINDIAELIRSRIPFYRDDEVFERILKCRMLMEEKEFNDFIKETKSILDNYLELLNESNNSEDDDAVSERIRIENFVESHKQEIEDFRNLLESFSEVE